MQNAKCKISGQSRFYLIANWKWQVANFGTALAIVLLSLRTKYWLFILPAFEGGGTTALEPTKFAIRQVKFLRSDVAGQ